MLDVSFAPRQPHRPSTPGLNTPEIPSDSSPANLDQVYTTTTPEYSPRSDYYNTMQLSAPPRFAREQNLGFLNEFEATDTMVIAQRMDNNHPGYMTAPQDVLPLQPTPMTSMTGQMDTNEHRTHSPTTTYHILTAINVLADDQSQYTTDTHVNVGFHQETETVTETITIHHQQGQQRTIEQIVATRNPDTETHTHTFSTIERQAPRNETPDWDESEDDELNLHITDDDEIDEEVDPDATTDDELLQRYERQYGVTDSSSETSNSGSLKQTSPSSPSTEIQTTSSDATTPSTTSTSSGASAKPEEQQQTEQEVMIIAQIPGTSQPASRQNAPRALVGMGTRWPNRTTRPPRPSLNRAFSQLPHAPLNATRTRNTQASTHQRTMNETREERTRSWLARPPPQARAIAEDINRRREQREEFIRLRHRTQNINLNQNRRSRSPRQMHHRYQYMDRGIADERYFSSPTFARRPANQLLSRNKRGTNASSPRPSRPHDAYPSSGNKGKVGSTRT